MRALSKIKKEDGWPQSWLDAYGFDKLEIYGERGNLGFSYAYENRHAKTLEAVRHVTPQGGSVLDLAAAQGNFSLPLAEQGYEVTWNDLRSELIDYVKLKYEFGNIEFIPGNILELSFESQFDTVMINEVIEHVAHPDEFLRKVSVMVRPGGHIIMTTPNGEFFRNSLPKFSDCDDPSIFESVQFKPDADGHIFLLHLDEVDAFAKSSGLLLEEVQIFNNFLTCGNFKTGSLLKVLPKKFGVAT